MATLDTGIGDTARNVGSTPSMDQGWRPCSATNQPISPAIQGKGKSPQSDLEEGPALAPPGVGRRGKTRSRNRPMKKKPKPTITRKDQNIGATDGTVSQAA